MPKQHLWAHNHIQFARMLAEINALGLSKAQYALLKESTDLSLAEINELFDRAELEWTRHKQRMSEGKSLYIRKYTPDTELAEFVQDTSRRPDA